MPSAVRFIASKTPSSEEATTKRSFVVYGTHEAPLMRESACVRAPAAPC